MPEIPFTQFLRPDGRTEATCIDVPIDIALMAQDFIDAGGSFTSEELRTGEVSLCAVFTIDHEEQDIACTICPNGPQVEHAVHNLIRTAFDFLQGRPRA